jgi:hypothetical protein
MIKNKKGQMEYIFIIVFVFVFIIAGGITWYVMDTLLNEIKVVPELAPYVNNTIVPAQLQYDTLLNYGLTILIIGMFISMIVSFAFIGSHPIVFIVHIIVLGVSIIAGAELSNIYNDNLATITEFQIYFQDKLIYPHLIITDLPIYLTVFGFISIIVLVSKYIYDKRTYGGGGIYVN